MLLDKHVSMFGLHHMGAIVTVCILVGCLVVIVCFKRKGGANLHSFPYSNCMCFLPTLLYTSGVGETSVDACVAPHGLHCHSVYTGRLLRCNCLLVKYSSEMVQTATCIYSRILTAWISSNLLCKPAVLEQQVLMFGLHHMSSNCHSMLVGWFVVVGIAYMKYSSETVQTGNLYLFSNSNCIILYQPSCKPVIEQLRVDVWVAPHGCHCNSLHTGRFFALQVPAWSIAVR